MLATRGCPDMKLFLSKRELHSLIPCLGSINLCACGDGKGLLIYFMLGSKLMHFIWNIALSFLGIRARPLCCHQSLLATICRRLGDCMHWSAAQVCSISLGPRQSKNAAFLASDWLVGSHSTTLIGSTLVSRSTCARICAACLGLVWHPSALLSSASYWPGCRSEGLWLAGPLTLHSPFCQSSRVRKCGPGIGEIARYLAKWYQR